MFYEWDPNLPSDASGPSSIMQTFTFPHNNKMNSKTTDTFIFFFNQWYDNYSDDS